MKASVITVDEAREFFEATRFRCDEGVKERCSSGLTQLITPLRNIMAANAMKYLGACFWRRVRLFVCHRLRQLHPKEVYEDSKKIVTLCLADEGESEDSFVKQYRVVIKEVQDRLEYLPLVDIVKGTTMTNSSVNLTTGVYNGKPVRLQSYQS
jgi:hypothetical protein